MWRLVGLVSLVVTLLQGVAHGDLLEWRQPFGDWVGSWEVYRDGFLVAAIPLGSTTVVPSGAPPDPQYRYDLPTGTLRPGSQVWLKAKSPTGVRGPMSNIKVVPFPTPTPAPLVTPSPRPPILLVP